MIPLEHASFGVGYGNRTTEVFHFLFAEGEIRSGDAMTEVDHLHNISTASCILELRDSLTCAVSEIRFKAP